MKNNGKYMKRTEFLECVRKTYENDSMDYLIALRDSLSLVIAERVNPSSVDYHNYEGYIKYL